MTANQAAHGKRLLKHAWQGQRTRSDVGHQMAGTKVLFRLCLAAIADAQRVMLRTSVPPVGTIVPCRRRYQGWLTVPVFVSDEVLLDVGFGPARAGLARLARRDLLLSSSEDAYEYGTIGLDPTTRVGTTGLSKFVRVQVRELAETDGCPRWALRWEATGTGGALFPVLDADISLVPAGGSSTVLTLTGSYRPPFGSLGAALDRAVLHRVAAATIRNFLTRVAARITGQPDPAGTAITGTCSAPPPEDHGPV